MGKRLKLLAVCLLLALLLHQMGKPVFAEDLEAKKLDGEAKILSLYLSNFDSPLQNHAQDFIDAAQTHKLDWKMLPAIAGVESTFGKQIPGGFNAWGWGVYGTQAIYFNSWKEGIFTVAKGLRENYLDKGLNDPYAINKVYAASTTWGARVSYFMQDIENFANKSTQDELAQNIGKKEATRAAAITKTAASSGRLTLK